MRRMSLGMKSNDKIPKLQEIRISQYDNDILPWREQIHSYSNILSLDRIFNIGMKTYNEIAVRYVILFIFAESKNRDVTRNLKTWSTSMLFQCDRNATLMLQRINSPQTTRRHSSFSSCICN
jgi:hypothetical protein